MAFPILIVFLIAAFIWIGVLTYLFKKMQKNYSVLTEGINKKTLDAVLSNIVKESNKSKEDIDRLIARCDTIEKDARFHIQKIGLMRFNPFKDTGGDQSFILSLMDDHNTGVVITALYSRSGTRWYAKRIMRGKGVEHELSDEEKKVVQQAQSVK